jgi:carbonic anhydrase
MRTPPPEPVNVGAYYMKFDLTYRYEALDRPARSHPMDSDAAFCRLCDGNRAFAALFSDNSNGADSIQTIIQLDPRDIGLSEDAGKAPKQRPFAAILGCSDARVPIELIFNEGPNDLFVLRVAGNELGTEVLGSLKYAVDHLGDSLRLIVVLGHSGCGAVSVAVDTFLEPGKYLRLATKHSLRSIVDRLLVVVQASSSGLLAAFGPEIVKHARYRQVLIETSIATNAALASYSIEQELGGIDPKRLRTAYGVYLLETREIWAPSPSNMEGQGLAAPPQDAAAFAEFSAAIIQSRRIRSLLASAG